MLTEHWPGIRFSSLYKTAPYEFEEQDVFLNSAAKVETGESPEEVSHVLHTIEKELKKDPPFKFGPRTIDLDVLLYNDQVISLENLTVPHPRMHNRRFVLEPLCELIDPTTKHPVVGKTWEELLGDVQEQECEKL